MTFLQTLSEARLLGIIRGTDADASVASALALAEEGVRLFEVSLTSTSALDVIRRIAEAAGPDVELGAGTVLSESDVEAALSHGATYIVTPAVAPSVAAAVRRGVPVLAGALTPTEVVAARDAGADAVKVFPASVFGPRYLKDLRAPFPDVPFVPVGGVDAAQVPEYLSHGAVAVGVASPLCGDAPDGGDLDALRVRAREFLQAVKA
ncbi:bifunctional 4-hydroxy-2-oxoglutarate aldolase/2-dehydro-3-deoxy-phosphogluconate aldolase [Sediminivirga luteola]|uniref:Aldolase n=1 Tax=Sediminivirga luteola TaxID=1774748 RepID=A0A8J2XK23_9MICO|nr:bifunctional 4-hydroxy-2-oxoglutarate aldolase/2-dehydro-3-deoxy-phosphogluconate aldolase [Sediminivirga luteola]MCI2264413.1 bifunctional 4-hydroxy-2-oxoglutarate aldolase/2-dehydro-3-deoxy-phosphogluconate aldolase [Sediminivirga luteola]GGA06008.1 aldolase [Sediminivirga luteola]